MPSALSTTLALALLWSVSLAYRTKTNRKKISGDVGGQLSNVIDLPANSPDGRSMAFVHLFEWSWDDIAKECEVFLAPKGFTAVQVSPPNEHISGDAWWTRYQPVSYKLISRSGDEAAFASMVKRCAAVGVGIYVDAVINHMAAGGGTGVAGSQYGGRQFPIFSPEDFHHNTGDNKRNCEVSDYNDKRNVQYCDLVGLADLATGKGYVQDRISEYINSLRGYGVAGFRVDAAKHIDAGELAGILGKTDSRMHRFLEVIGHGNEPVQPDQYYHLGQITEFSYAIKLAENLQNPNGIQYLNGFGESWGLMPTKNAVVFIDNHDTQRGHAGEAALTYKSGKIYDFANIFMLAHPYGYPQVMSSYNFGNSDQGPPKGSPVHQHWGVNCGNDKPWQCEHRRTHIANMVAWRKSAGDALMNDWMSAGGDKIAFCRGSGACIALNRNERQDWQASFKVAVPPGEYCNIITGDGADCERVHVGGDHMVHVKVDPMSAVAFHVGRKPGQQPPHPQPASQPEPVVSNTKLDDHKFLVPSTGFDGGNTTAPAFPHKPPSYKGPAEVYVMLGLTQVTNDGKLNDPGNFAWKLDKLRDAGADGVMVDVWWGLTERQARKYDFSAYQELVRMVKEKGMRVQFVASFHQCGGNVGDDCNIPLPSWVTQNDDIWFTDRNGNANKEYITFFADGLKLKEGRTPIEIYGDWMSAMASTFSSDLGTTIVEIQVGMGPCGELRYPAYPLSRWNFPGVGEFQVYDKYARASLKAAGQGKGFVDPPSDAGHYNSKPWETRFFQSGYKSEYGRFFLDWYFSSMKAHGASVLQAANKAFRGKVALAGKVAGIHWWYGSEHHAAELTAGYYNTNGRDAYAEVADVFANNGHASLDFTCLEMRNTEQPDSCQPENLVNQVKAAAMRKGVHFNGENALPRYDWTAYEKILAHKDALSAFTFLRLDQKLVTEGFDNFKRFVQSMHR